MTRSPPARRDAGFTLLSVLVALVIMGVGVLGMVRTLVGVTSAATQNGNVSTMASLSNGFWGVVQARPTLLANLAGTYTSSTLTSAPAALQDWLAQAVNLLPGASVTIATSPDAGNGTSCAPLTGCTVKMTLRWTQVAAPGLAASTRAQDFYFQFGL